MVLGIEEVKSFVESKFEEDYSRNEALKGFSPRLMMLHSEQVAKLALKIGQMEGASLDVLETAALLHDISTYEKAPSGKRSEVLSAETAERFLRN